jgi:hypothetical protein
MPTRDTRISNCIVFYDFKAEEANLKGWFYYIVEWFEKHGRTPTHISLTGEGIKSRKKQTFKGGKKSLEARDFQKIDSIVVDSYPPQFNYHHDFFFSGGISLKTVGGRLDMTLCFDDNFVSFERETLEKIIKELSIFIHPRYSFCHQRAFKKGPDFYTWGTIMGLDGYDFPEERPEEERISKWNHEYCMPDGDYRTGMLREIYPLNILSEAHLVQTVGTHTLREWINSSSQHGDLKPLNDQLWSWWVPVENISLVTKSLKDTGIILCI